MVGMIDSGIGGLTIARELRRLDPGVGLAYVADTAHFPYGNRCESAIEAWCVEMGRWLLDRHAVDVLVIACNTATAAAAEALREAIGIPVVGVEPAVKPAIALSASGRIGVLATPTTIASGRLERLVRDHAGDSIVHAQACEGLAEALERHWPDLDPVSEPLRLWLEPMLRAGVDVVVLGCTHYPLAKSMVESLAGPTVKVIDSGGAVAKRILDLGTPLRRGPLTLHATEEAPTLARLGGTITGGPTEILRLRWIEGRLTENA